MNNQVYVDKYNKNNPSPVVLCADCANLLSNIKPASIKTDAPCDWCDRSGK